MKRKHALIVCTIAVLIVAAAAYSYFRGDPAKIPSEKYDDFAKCLSARNVTMYGVTWCHVCGTQKEMFGDSFQYVNYVECTENQELCKSKGVTSYPTWEINGMLYVGLRALNVLSSASGCQLN